MQHLEAKASKALVAHPGRMIKRYFFAHRCRSLLWLLLLLALSPVAQAQEVQPAGRENPKLFIGGGGVMGGLNKAFIELAGEDARLVVIPGAKEDPDLDAHKKKWQSRGFKHVHVLHTNDPKVAGSKRFAEPLKAATAVWISGGVQQNLAKRYVGTPVETELTRLLERGGTIGGSSAGAAIQAKAMVYGGNVDPQVGRGFDLLQGAIVDQHFLRRNRLRRLMDAVRENPKRIGYGIDEGTALVVHQGKMRVIGNSYVMRIQMVDEQLRIDAFKKGDELPLPRQTPG